MDHASSLRPAPIGQDRLAFLDAQAPLPALANVALAVAVIVTKWSIRRKTRKALGRLEPHHLKDIGMTKAQAWREAALPFWLD
ncbi:MAG: DUF1127 domain-containing protein [Geminicoccaceae bacterium]|nr:DUF1127 domain-containing protein [Maritimibacter sp.]